MAAPSFRLNRKGVAEVLRTQMADVVNDVTEQVAAKVRSIVGDDVDVQVSAYTTDRQAASVTIADPEGLQLQARDGALTRAAAAVGLDVNAR